jgi:diguanylate cyclase (GGDEF)-like protein/PAS domain S-box-containing protein
LSYSRALDAVETTLDTLEQRLSRIGGTMSRVREELAGETGGKVDAEAQGPPDAGRNRGAPDQATGGDGESDAGPAGGKVNAEDGLGESLFEELLEQVIKGNHARQRLGLDSQDPRQLLNRSGDLAVELQPDGAIHFANPAFTMTFGYTPDEILETSFTAIVEPQYREHLDKRIAAFRDGATSSRVYSPDDMVLFRARTRDNEVLSLEGLLTSIRFGSQLHPVVVMRNLEQQQGLLKELRETKHNYDILSETLNEAILRLDEDLNIVFANSAVRHTFGHEPEELRGRHFSELFPAGVFGRHEHEFRKYFIVDDQDRSAFGLQNSMELLATHKHRGIAPVELSFGNSKDFNGRNLTCIIRDITQRKNDERRLRHLAYHDQLTGLGNRDLFHTDVGELLTALERVGTGLGALMFLDLDGFKQVNDTMGHEAGDELLIETGKRLQETLRQNDQVYRFGGDEFVVLLGYIHQREDAARVANKLLAAVRSPYQLKSAEASGGAATVSVGVSIGIALIPNHGSSVEELTKAADLAMYSAKSAGRNTMAFYTSSLDARAHERWQLEQGIRGGLERGEFHLFYQPLVNNDGYVQGFEALLRWDHPTLGPVSPGKFIPVAEETGLIVPLGNWVLETAFKDLKAWNHAGHTDTYVTVNLSPKQFEQPDLVATIGNIFERTGAKPANVKLEITETCIMSAPDSATRKMRELKERYPGLTIAIDDFGTGYSSLSYLSRLPADTIKIDLSFVTKLFAMNNHKIVNAIINLAHSLQLDVVAEGVESVDQWQFFNDHACRTLQGYHFNKPAPAAGAVEMLRRGKLG